MTSPLPRYCRTIAPLCAVLALLALPASLPAEDAAPALDPRLAKLKARNEKAIRKTYPDEADPARRNAERVLVYILESGDSDDVKADLLEENLENLHRMAYRGDDSDGDGLADLDDRLPAIAFSPVYWRVESLAIDWDPEQVAAAGGAGELSLAFPERPLRDEFRRRCRTTLFHRNTWLSDPPGRAGAGSIHPLRIARASKTPTLDALASFQLFGTGAVGWNSISAARAAQAGALACRIAAAQGADSPATLVFALRIYNLCGQDLRCRNIEIPVYAGETLLGWAIPVRDELRERGFLVPADKDDGIRISFRVRLQAKQVERIWPGAGAPVAPGIAFEHCRGRILAGPAGDEMDITRRLREILRATVPFEVDGGDAQPLVWRVAPKALGEKTRVTDVFSDLNPLAGMTPLLAGRAGWPRSLASWDNGALGLWWHVRIGGSEIRRDADWTTTPVDQPVRFSRETSIPPLADASAKKLAKGNASDPGIDLVLGLRAAGAGHDREALERLGAAASAGFLPAAVALGDTLLRSGDARAAAEAFRQAAAHGDPAAQFRLAGLSDEANALALLRRAAGGRLPEAECALAERLARTGDDGRKEAEDLLRAAASQDHPAAQAALGGLLAKQGEAAEAAWWLAHAAAMGDTAAQRAYGLALLSGDGVPRQPRQAVPWLLLAANQGDAAAQAALGRCSLGGNGVRRSAKAAADWFRKSAEGGDPEGQLWFGLCLMQGIGVRANPEEGGAWIERSAESGYAMAEFLFGAMSLRMARGTRAAAAAADFRRAAEQDLPIAQLWLGYCLMNGLGTEKDTAEARVWFEKAEKNGIPAARDYLRALDAAEAAEATPEAAGTIPESTDEAAATPGTADAAPEAAAEDAKPADAAPEAAAE